MNIQARIQEAMSRRHKNEDGFTLIELLVVILIIAILAAVAIFALLSSLGAAKKSNAKATLKSAEGAVTSTLAGRGETDYTNISVQQNTAAPAARGTTGTLDKAEKDIVFTQAALTTASSVDSYDYTGKIVSLNPAPTATRLVMQTRDADGNCFFIEMNKASETKYAAVAAGTGACASPAAGATAWKTNQKSGWAL